MELEFWFVRPQSNLLNIMLATLALQAERNGEFFFFFWNWPYELDNSYRSLWMWHFIKLAQTSPYCGLNSPMWWSSWFQLWGLSPHCSTRRQTFAQLLSWDLSFGSWLHLDCSTGRRRVSAKGSKGTDIPGAGRKGMKQVFLMALKPPTLTRWLFLKDNPF